MAMKMLGVGRMPHGGRNLAASTDIFMCMAFYFPYYVVNVRTNNIFINVVVPLWCG